MSMQEIISLLATGILGCFLGYFGNWQDSIEAQLDKAYKHFIKGEDYQWYKHLKVVTDNSSVYYTEPFFRIFIYSDGFHYLSNEDQVKKCTDIFAKFAYIDSICNGKPFQDVYKSLTDIEGSFCWTTALNIYYTEGTFNNDIEKFRLLYREVVDKSFMESQKNLSTQVVKA